MSNRHERRRAAKVMRVEQRTMSVEEFASLPSGCAWAGCTATTAEPHKHSWSNMLIYRGRPALDFLEIDPRQMARDCVLCPEHARYLDENLLVDIGGMLRNVAGNA